MQTTSELAQPTSWLDRPISQSLPRLRVITVLMAAMFLLTVFSRFYIVDRRVMSHDETNHVVPGYELYQGRGYRHDPITHGPFQFHALAFSYFLLGDSDFSARVPAVLFSIATVVAVTLLFTRYLGRAGALIAGLLFLISPYLLFYGRYTRNEAFVGLYAVILLYGVLRYLDRGDLLSLTLITLSTAFHFITKETSFIYVAQLLIFLALLFVNSLLKQQWPNDRRQFSFLLAMGGAIAAIIVALFLAVWHSIITKGAAEGDAAVALPLAWQQVAAVGMVALALILGVLAIVILVRSLGVGAIRAQRSFDMLVLVGTLILPQLAPFPVKMIGLALGANWNPLDYTSAGIFRTGTVIVILTLAAALIGLWWKPRVWLAQFGLCYAIFLLFYTTFFTNGFGFFTGLVGSLGYWLDQQGVHRGEQPLYFYALIQIPLYEYLAALGSLVAVFFGLRYRRFSTVPGNHDVSPARQPLLPADGEPRTAAEQPSDEDSANAPAAVSAPLNRVPVLWLLIFWSITSLVAYSVAGEKMPWLTVHIAVPMLLTAGWGLGFLVETTPWKRIAHGRGLLAALLLVVLMVAAGGLLSSLLGVNPPFQGSTLEQLRGTSSFLLALVGLVASAAGLFTLLRDWPLRNIARMVLVLFFGVLALLTARTAARASYINYDYATEYLVYAHAGPGPKQVLEQVEEISRRLTGGKDVVVAYDNDGLYPYWWYFRDYPNKRWYQADPTRDLRDVPLIIAGNETMSKVDSITEDTHFRFDYIRLWWPNQDYFGLTSDRIWEFISDRQMRTALFRIWLNRDFSLYASLKKDANIAAQFTLEKWQPSDPMRFYVRKDVVGQIWNYGAAVVETPVVDPYQDKMTTMSPDIVLGGLGQAEGQFNNPHGIAVAPDGSLYVADSANHRIQHLTPDGQVLHVWGTFADAAQGSAPGGTFYEPWAVAVGPDGSVYVADTWNHRIQKFTAEGEFLLTWGYFGQAESPDAFWGPRAVLVDNQGRVYVTDTGNKRIAIFDEDGNFVTQIGSVGFDLGQFDEPMGIAADDQGNLFVADTWNQRIQWFASENDGFVPISAWDMAAWSGNSLQNYPFLAVDGLTNLYATDPEGFRVLQFTTSGEFVRGWGDYSSGSDGFGLPSGLAVDQEGGLWVSDAGNHTLLHFNLQEPVNPAP